MGPRVPAQPARVPLLRVSEEARRHDAVKSGREDDAVGRLEDLHPRLDARAEVDPHEDLARRAHAGDDAALAGQVARKVDVLPRHPREAGLADRRPRRAVRAVHHRLGRARDGAPLAPLEVLADAYAASLALDQLFSGAAFLAANPPLMTAAAKFAFCSAIGQSAIFFTMANFDPLVTTTVTTAANNTFGSVSNGKKTATRVLPTEEQLEHRQRYLQQQQQLNQFNAFNA
mgnify:CR=1 FL=1